MPRKTTRARIQRERWRIAGQKPNSVRSRLYREIYLNGALAFVLALGPIGYQMLEFPHRMVLALAAWGICLLVIGRIVWLAAGRLANKVRVSRHRSELSLDVPLAFAFAFA